MLWDRLEGKQFRHGLSRCRGSNCLRIELWIAAVVTGEGRPFAMMAAQGLDVLWVRSSLSLIVYTVAAAASQTGMCVEMSVLMQPQQWKLGLEVVLVS